MSGSSGTGGGSISSMFPGYGTGAAPSGGYGGGAAPPLFNKSTTTSAPPGGTTPGGAAPANPNGWNASQQGLYGVPPMQAGTPEWLSNMMNGYSYNLNPNYQNPRNFGMFAYGNDFANNQNRYISNFGPDAMNPWGPLGGGGAVTGWPIQPGQPGGPPPAGTTPPATTPPGTTPPAPPKSGPFTGSMRDAVALGLGTGNSSALNELVKGGMTQESVNQGINSAMYNNTKQTNEDAMDAYRKANGITKPVQWW